MTRPDDYRDEMGMSVISDVEVEQILGRGLLEDPALAPLISMINTLAELRNMAPSPEVRTRHVSMAAAVARQATVRQPNQRPAARAARFRLLPRMGTSLAALALVVGMTGVAVASDAAAPGDPLHDIDLALEELGIGDGGRGERIVEARELNERGMTFEALSHLSITFSHHDDRPAADALMTAAERIREQENSGGGVQEIQAGVADMLDWMAAHDPKSPGFGQAVAGQAEALGQEVTGGSIEEAGSDGPGKSGDKGSGQSGPPSGKGPGG